MSFLCLQGCRSHTTRCNFNTVPVRTAYTGHSRRLFRHVNQNGWEMNPAKILRTAEQVNFLGCHCNEGHREIRPKARQRISDFPVPRTTQEAQIVVGQVGYWRAHLPDLGVSLQPFFKVTRKTYEFEWGVGGKKFRRLNMRKWQPEQLWIFGPHTKMDQRSYM